MIVDVSQLREALKKCSGTVNYKASMPICVSVLLDGKDNALIIRATDLEKMVEISIPCSTEPFSSCVPYRILNKFVSQGMGTVSLELRNKQLVLDRPKIGKLNIGGIKEASEFPPYPSAKMPLVWRELDAKEVCRLFSVVVLGCAKEESRPILTGVCCRQGEIASVDGFRLCNAVSPKFDFGLDPSVSKVVPRLTVLQVIKLFGKQEKMQIAFDENTVYFKSGGVSLASQLLQGTYPKYEQLIPASFSSKVVFSVPLMLERLKLMDSLSSSITRLWFEQLAGGDLLYLSGKSAEDDDTVYDLNLPCKIETTEVGKIAVQYNYLFDAIKAFSICSMELTNPSSLMKFTGDIKGLSVTVMPMFVQW